MEYKKHQYNIVECVSCSTLSVKRSVKKTRSTVLTEKTNNAEANVKPKSQHTFAVFGIRYIYTLSAAILRWWIVIEWYCMVFVCVFSYSLHCRMLNQSVSIILLLLQFVFVFSVYVCDTMQHYF